MDVTVLPDITITLPGFDDLDIVICKHNHGKEPCRHCIRPRDMDDLLAGRGEFVLSRRPAGHFGGWLKSLFT